VAEHLTTTDPKFEGLNPDTASHTGTKVARGSSTVVKYSTTNCKTEGWIPAAAKHKEKMADKSFT
jgi:hypothetical protein